MWPGRYFPDSYFAPRYWAKFGATPPAPVSFSTGGRKVLVKSELNIRSEITRLNQIAQQLKAKPDPNAALIGPVTREQLLANSLSKIQDHANQMNQRVAALEVPIILNSVFNTAGASAGFIIVTVGNRTFKVAIREVK